MREKEELGRDEERENIYEEGKRQSKQNGEATRKRVQGINTKKEPNMNS